ncbi:MAG: ABC transporter ATP-binding protein [Halolamina sp.]
MTDIHLDGVAKRYGETTAVDVADLRVRDGEFFTLLGPSGCGKTTTLRLLAGFESPTAGTVRVDGRDQTGVAPEDRDVGVVFQNYALFPNMTVGENVAYGLGFADPPGDRTAEERVAELLELVDLPAVADRDPDTLSGGQRQRVALARALAPGPRLLLLDEPMSALDARLRERLRVQVKEIQSELDVTTVYVTHDQEEALAISDRVAVMRAGTVEQVGRPRAVYREPATRFVAEFVGDNNVFEGEVVGVDGETATLSVDDVDARLRVSGAELRPGDCATVCVRPERLRVGKAGDESGHVGGDESGHLDGGDHAAERNRLRVAVESAEFLGESTRYHCRWPDGDDHGRELLLRTTGGHGQTAAADETASVGGEPVADRLGEGEGSVIVAFAPEDVHVVERR